MRNNDVLCEAVAKSLKYVREAVYEKYELYFCEERNLETIGLRSAHPFFWANERKVKKCGENGDTRNEVSPLRPRNSGEGNRA